MRRAGQHDGPLPRGGGGGGEDGGGGAGGIGGHASIAVYLFGSSPTFTDCTFQIATGGSGGAGRNGALGGAVAPAGSARRPAWVRSGGAATVAQVARGDQEAAVRAARAARASGSSARAAARRLSAVRPHTSWEQGAPVAPADRVPCSARHRMASRGAASRRSSSDRTSGPEAPRAGPIPPEGASVPARRFDTPTCRRA